MAGNTSNASANYSFGNYACEGASSSRGGASNDHVYAFTPAISGVYTLTLESEFDAALYVFTDCADVDGTCLGGSDSAISGDEQVSFTAMARTIDTKANTPARIGTISVAVSDCLAASLLSHATQTSSTPSR